MQTRGKQRVQQHRLMSGDKHLAQTIGKVCRQARERRLLTQKEVAGSIGVSVEFYGRLEHGRALPRVTTLAALIKVLGVNANAVFGLKHGRHCPAVGLKHGRHCPADERPQLRRLVPALRRASPGALKSVAAVLRAFEEKGKRSKARP